MISPWTFISSRSLQLAFILALCLSSGSYPQTECGFPEATLPKWKSCDARILWFSGLSLVLQRWFCSTCKKLRLPTARGKKAARLAVPGNSCLPMGYLPDMPLPFAALRLAQPTSTAPASYWALFLCVSSSKSFICILTFHFLTCFAQEQWGTGTDARRTCWPLKWLTSLSHACDQLRGNCYQWMPSKHFFLLDSFSHTKGI